MIATTHVGSLVPLVCRAIDDAMSRWRAAGVTTIGDGGFGTFASYGKNDPDMTRKTRKALREGVDLADVRL